MPCALFLAFVKHSAHFLCRPSPYNLGAEPRLTPAHVHALEYSALGVCLCAEMVSRWSNQKMVSLSAAGVFVRVTCADNSFSGDVVFENAVDPQFDHSFEIPVRANQQESDLILEVVHKEAFFPDIPYGSLKLPKAAAFVSKNGTQDGWYGLANQHGILSSPSLPPSGPPSRALARSLICSCARSLGGGHAGQVRECVDHSHVTKYPTILCGQATVPDGCECAARRCSTPPAVRHPSPSACSPSPSISCCPSARAPCPTLCRSADAWCVSTCKVRCMCRLRVCVYYCRTYHKAVRVRDFFLFFFHVSPLTQSPPFWQK